MSVEPDDTAGTRGVALTVEELARSQHAERVEDAEELVAEVWESDEELDAFLADLRMSRSASTA